MTDLGHETTGPTDDQLVRTLLVMGCPVAAAEMSVRNATMREGACNFHALVQRAVLGDEEANAKVKAIQATWSQAA
jgi:hypothetical protein